MTGIEESNSQFLGAWKHFSRHAANGAIEDLGGVVAMYSNVPVPFLNVFGIDTPVRDDADLIRRIEKAKRYAHKAGWPYFIAVCTDFVPQGLQSRLDAIFGEAGFNAFMEWTGMVCDPVRPARKTAPAELELRPATTAELRVAINDLNSAAYGMPAEPGRDPLSREPLWAAMHGVVGCVDGQPVATATTLPVDGRLYVALVATHPDQQRHGYAEACMSESLRLASEATGLKRSILHATDAGHPVYLKMGYYDVTRFILYMEGEETHA